MITLHPAVWARAPASMSDGWASTIIPGPRQTLDLLLHELLHVDVAYRRGGWTGHSSHDNPTWCAAIEAAAVRLRGTPLELPAFTARPTRRSREDGVSKRRTPEGCLSMDAVSRWPSPLREPSYYREQQVPFAFPTA